MANLKQKVVSSTHKVCKVQSRPIKMRAPILCLANRDGFKNAFENFLIPFCIEVRVSAEQQESRKGRGVKCPFHSKAELHAKSVKS